MLILVEILFLTLYVAAFIIRPFHLLLNGRTKKSKNATKVNSEPISIIVPAHNEEDLLEKTVSNLITQKLGRFEIIIGENNSTDNTLQIARRLEREYPGIVRVMELSPPSDVMIISWVLNQMIKVARYDLICRIDADSVLRDEFSIAKLMNPMIDDTSISATGGNVKIINDGKSALLDMQGMEYMIANELNKNHMKHTSICLSGCYMGFRKSRLKNGFVETKGISEDMSITIELSERSKGKTMFVKDSLVYTDGMKSVKELKKQRMWWSDLRFNTFIYQRGAILNRKFGLVGVHLFISMMLSCRSFIGLFIRGAESLQSTLLDTLVWFAGLSVIHFLVTTWNVVAANIISEDRERINLFHILQFSMWYGPMIGMWRFVAVFRFFWSLYKRLWIRTFIRAEHTGSLTLKQGKNTTSM